VNGPIVGVLLAAGSASRFGGGKLLAPLSDGTTVATSSLRSLAAAVDSVVAVVRAEDDALATRLARGGARVTVCPVAEEGMSASLAWGIRSSPVASGWLVMLADMPWIAVSTIQSVANALRRGASVTAPRVHGQRGHPVGFASKCYADLIALTGDEGARRVVMMHSQGLELIDVDDAGALRDVDTPKDLS